VVVNLKAKKRLVSRVTGVGIHRIRFDTDHLIDIADAITRANIRSLITANTIKIKPFTGTSKGRAHTPKKLRETKEVQLKDPNKVEKVQELVKKQFTLQRFVH